MSDGPEYRTSTFSLSSPVSSLLSFCAVLLYFHPLSMENYGEKISKISSFSCSYLSTHATL